MILLGLIPPYTEEDIKQAYRTRALAAHPDAGADAKDFLRLQNAYEQALEYVSFRSDRRHWIGKHMERYIAVEAVMEELAALGAAFDVQTADWLEKSFGEFAQIVDQVQTFRLWNSPHGDQALHTLVMNRRHLGTLKMIDLTGTRVSDATVLRLSAFEALRELRLGGTGVGNDVLQLVDWLPHLQKMDVSGTRIGAFARWRLTNKLKRKRETSPLL